MKNEWNFPPNFERLVLGCIKANFCKKICVRQHFSSSTRFASFCTAAISKFSQIIDPLIPKDMFRLVCLVKLVFFAREGVAF